jgi:hypothetical protein
MPTPATNAYSPSTMQHAPAKELAKGLAANGGLRWFLIHTVDLANPRTFLSKLHPGDPSSRVAWMTSRNLDDMRQYLVYCIFAEVLYGVENGDKDGMCRLELDINRDGVQCTHNAKGEASLEFTRDIGQPSGPDTRIDFDDFVTIQIGGTTSRGIVVAANQKQGPNRRPMLAVKAHIGTCICEELSEQWARPTFTKRIK